MEKVDTEPMLPNDESTEATVDLPPTQEATGNLATVDLPPTRLSSPTSSTEALPPSARPSDGQQTALFRPSAEQPTVEMNPSPDASTLATLDHTALGTAPSVSPADQATLDAAPVGTAGRAATPTVAVTQDASDEDATFIQGVDSAKTPVQPAPRKSAPSRMRYRVLRPHARGGLGEVFVALDEELRREVALKEIQIRHSDHFESRTRFLIEAEVTGGLEHPGIVPVYGLGQYDDGRPYYAMRFIRGESMRKAIERYHDSERQNADPGQRVLELRQLLGRFNDVCDAIHYAHTRGVLHRDLKPDNIMLGDFGETLVVDWGLAKPVDRAEPLMNTTLSQLKPMSATSGSVTMMGSAVGTPQYMSPEQAHGHLDQLGPASDIYSLGATLYHLVSGTTPFQERNLRTLLDKVKRGDFRSPREVNPTVPPELSAICMKAMAVEPEKRYRTARALADDVEHWLADEPVSVYREPWTKRAARWAKRHRTAVTTSAALLVAAVIGLAITTILVKREQSRTEVQRRLAEANFGQARDAVDQMLTELGEVELADVPQAEPVRRKMLGKALAFYRRFLQQRGKDASVQQGTAQAYIRLGDILEMLGDYDGSDAAYKEAFLLLEPLAKAKSGPRRDLARAHHQRAILLKKLGRYKASEREFVEAIDTRKAIAAANPSDVDDAKAARDSLYHLGALLARLSGRKREVEGAYETALNEQKALVAQARKNPDDRRKLARYLNNYGILLQKTNPAEAEGIFRDALQHQTALVDASPGVAGYQWELARTHSNLAAFYAGAKQRVDAPLENWTESEKQYVASLDRLKKLADDFPTVPDYPSEEAVVYVNLSRLRMIMARAIKDEAVSHKLGAASESDVKSAIALLDTLVKQFPGRPDYRQRLGLAYYRLGQVLTELRGRSAEPERLFEQAIAIQRKLVNAYEGVPEYQSNLGSSLSQMGRLFVKNEPAKARPFIEEALRLQRDALEGDTDNAFYSEYIRNDIKILTHILQAVGEHAEAANVIETLPTTAGSGLNDYCIASRALAQCIPVASDDRRLSPEKRREVEEDYARRAIKLLRELVRKKFKDVKELEAEEYKPLQNRDDFRRVKRALETNAEPILG
jgi:serine/threonine-protein kinase